MLGRCRARRIKFRARNSALRVELGGKAQRDFFRRRVLRGVRRGELRLERRFAFACLLCCGNKLLRVRVYIRVRLRCCSLLTPHGEQRHAARAERARLSLALLV